MRVECLPNVAMYRECLQWLKQFFELECQYPPNRNNYCELPSAIYNKKMVYDLFQKTCQLQYTAAEYPYCSLSQFLDVWRRCYPNVKIRKYLAVSGTIYIYTTTIITIIIIREVPDLLELS